MHSWRTLASILQAWHKLIDLTQNPVQMNMLPIDWPWRQLSQQRLGALLVQRTSSSLTRWILKMRGKTWTQFVSTCFQSVRADQWLWVYVRARQYLFAYHTVDRGQLSSETQQDCSKYGPVVFEKLLGQFKTHQRAMDFDFNIVMSAGDWTRFIAFVVLSICVA